MKNIKEEIEKIPERNFYGCGSVDAELEAYGDKTYIIPLPLTLVRDEYYGANCIENIRENDDWIEDKVWIKEYFLSNMLLIEIYGE